MRFVKYSSNGNDFLITTAHTLNDSSRAQLAQRVCERHNGIGADGMVVVIPTHNTPYSYQWDFYNADGSLAAMCGNASRSVGHYAYMEGIAPKQHSFLTQAGIIHIHIDEQRDTLVQSDLGAYKILEEHIIESNPYGVDSWALLNSGVPHLVGFVKDREALTYKKDALLAHLRQAYNANINLAFADMDKIFYMTYERGVEDITEACGTGAAAVFALALNNKLCQNPTTLIPPSNEPLTLAMSEYNHILLQGEVKRIALCEWL